MKKIEFETSKGSWLVLDSKDAPSSFNRYLRDIEKELRVRLTEGYKLSEITEEQVSDIVDEPLFGKHYRDYTFIPTLDDSYAGEFRLNTAIESLHSLLKSKGIHLFENPHPRRYIMAMTDKGIVDTTEKLYLESEQKTFYNPYIFKL